MDKKKITPILIRAVICCGLVLLGMAIGGWGINRYIRHQYRVIKKIADADTGLLTDKIAVVNLDEGIIVQDEHINYAEQLLINPKDNFLLTGLEDARQGYATGIYAGYVIIPANFSNSVVSLNDTPVRAEISYVINSELQEDVKEQVIYDVLEMVNNLNDSVSYMYMHSVLGDLHAAQDEADKIMNNDLKEKEAIDAVQAYDLVALVPVTELTEIENTIEPVDISEYMSKNAEFAGEIGLKYTEYLMESEAEHQRINEEAIGLMDEMHNTSSIISGISLIENGEKGTVYQSGEEELNNMFEEYSTAFGTSVAEQEENIIKMYQDINCYLDEYDRALDAHQSQNYVLYHNTLDELEVLFNRYKENGYTIVSEEEIQSMKSQIQDQNTLISNQRHLIERLEEREQADNPEQEDEAELNTDIIQNIDVGDLQEYKSYGDEKNELTTLQQSIVEILEGNNYYIFGGTLLDQEGKPMQDEDGKYIPLTSILEPYRKKMYLDNGEPDIGVREEILKEQMAVFEQIDTEKVMSCIDENVLAPIQQNVDSIVTSVLDQYEIEQEQLMAYNEAIMEYNPLEYIDRDEIQLLTKDMMDNGMALSEAVLETDLQQMEYVTNVYTATRQDLFALQESITAAKEDSDKAVEEGLQELKDTKNANSILNQQILDDFTNILPYTRLGSLEYVQAYEFMVNPIGSIDMVQGESRQRTQSDSVRSANDNLNVVERFEADIQNIIVFICMMICVIIVVTTIKYHFHKKEESYELE